MKPLKCCKNNVCNIFRAVVLFGVRKMLQTLFLQHFNGFILPGTFVVYQKIYIIFSKIKFFPLEYYYYHYNIIILLLIIIINYNYY